MNYRQEKKWNVAGSVVLQGYILSIYVLVQKGQRIQENPRIQRGFRNISQVSDEAPAPAGAESSENMKSN